MWHRWFTGLACLLVFSQNPLLHDIIKFHTNLSLFVLDWNIRSVVKVLSFLTYLMPYNIYVLFVGSCLSLLLPNRRTYNIYVAFCMQITKMASSSSNNSNIRLNPRLCDCGRTAAIHIVRTNQNEYKGRVYFVCQSRYVSSIEICLQIYYPDLINWLSCIVD